MRVPITSFQNSRIKYVNRLRNRRRRDSAQETMVEGTREIQHALNQHIVPSSAYICLQLVEEEAETAVLLTQLEQLAQTHHTRLFDVTPELYAKIAYRGDSGGLLVTIPYWHLSLAQLPLSPTPLFVVVENAEKPGNIGGILRTADAAQVNGVIVCADEHGTGTDLFNPNVIRASLGAIFSVPIAMGQSREVIKWLQENNIKICAASPDGDMLYTAVNFKEPTAIVTGSESKGLTSAWFSEANNLAVIPMFGKVDSLNLSVSTALFVYEAIRQRTQTKMNHQKPIYKD